MTEVASEIPTGWPLSRSFPSGPPRASSGCCALAEGALSQFQLGLAFLVTILEPTHWAQKFPVELKALGGRARDV